MEVKNTVVEPTVPLIAVLGIGVLFFGASSGLFPSLASIMSNEVSYCTDTPFDSKCVCQIGMQKIEAGFGRWDCVPKIDLPTSYQFPLTTWEEVYAYTDEQMGGLTCQGEYFYRQPYQTGPLPVCEGPMCDKEIYIIECAKIVGLDEQGNPVAGQSAWNLYFDHKDGFIHKRFCKQELVQQQCPVNIPFRTKG